MKNRSQRKRLVKNWKQICLLFSFSHKFNFLWNNKTKQKELITSHALLLIWPGAPTTNGFTNISTEVQSHFSAKGRVPLTNVILMIFIQSALRTLQINVLTGWLAEFYYLWHNSKRNPSVNRRGFKIFKLSRALKLGIKLFHYISLPDLQAIADIIVHIGCLYI